MGATVLWILLLGALAQNAQRLPLTIEVKQDVEIRPDDWSAHRGILYVDDLKMVPFQLKKGQRFQMVRTSQEGSCRIRIADKEYGLASCPWRPGFGDHQADIFAIVEKTSK
jgi:hypothetical protein